MSWDVRPACLRAYRLRLTYLRLHLADRREADFKELVGGGECVPKNTVSKTSMLLETPTTTLPGGIVGVRGRRDFSRCDPSPGEAPPFSNFGPPADHFSKRSSVTGGYRLNSSPTRAIRISGHERTPAAGITGVTTANEARTPRTSHPCPAASLHDTACGPRQLFNSRVDLLRWPLPGLNILRFCRGFTS